MANQNMTIFQKLTRMFGFPGQMKMDNNGIYHQNNPTKLSKEQYREYSWLFGRSK